MYIIFRYSIPHRWFRNPPPSIPCLLYIQEISSLTYNQESPQLYGTEEYTQKRRENELHLQETITDIKAKGAYGVVNLQCVKDQYNIVTNIERI